MKKRKSLLSFVMSVLFILTAVIPHSGQAVSASDSSVTIHRDEYGVPHIYANSIDDMYQAYGYVMAQDRLFQLEMFKRANEGTASAVFGEEYLTHDEKMRRDGYSNEEIQQMIEDMDSFAREVLENFAKGIDTYVQEALEDPEEKLSKEFSKYNMQPERWSGVDVLRLYMASMTVFMDQEQELQNAQFLQELTDEFGEEEGKAIFNDVIWLNDSASPTTSDSEASSGSGTPFGQYTNNNAGEEAGEAVTTARDRFSQTTKELGVPLKVGSNAVVVGSSQSASENPIMFGGPQVGFSAPGFIYEVGLHGPEFDIQGSSFIGYPFIMFGTTEEMSFGATAGYGDVVDIFEETLNPDNPNEYLHNGEWKEFEKQTETFEIKQEDGTIETVQRDYYYSVHGPVIWKDEESGTAYTKSWSFRGTEADSWAAYLNMNWAEDVDEFHEAAKDYTMSLNWFYADNDDNIGYFHTGKIPVRDERIDWRLPTPGTGEYDWKGFRSPEDNPSEINPERGYIANWNNKPAPNWNANERNSRWGVDNRVHKFIDGIEERESLTVKDINDINYEASFANLDEKWFKPFLLNVLSQKTDDPVYEDIHEELKAWNGLKEDKNNDGYYDKPVANLVLDAWVNQLEERILKDDLQDLQEYAGESSSSLLIRILQEEQAALKTEYNWLNGQSVEEIAAESLEEAVTELQEEHGESITDWEMPIETMTFGAESLVGVPHGLGDQEEIISMNRGSENHFVEMTQEGPSGQNVTPPGQIGFINQNGEYSQHYRDQIDLFKSFEYKPMHFYQEDVQEHAVETVELTFDHSTVTDVIEQKTGTVEVPGYIVGNVKNKHTFALEPAFYNNDNLLIADSPFETDPSNMLLVSLKAQDKHAFGLKINPDYVGQKINVAGELHNDKHGFVQLKHPENIHIVE
ncbi:penicillin amidase [Alteribacillus persepolensis]|uniref:Penicillin amidase n=1 Tax=Alteribacillus persepolensis TaxID=568899 RepID=A0A1G8GCD9_9BACI|nr:penicillin acylase family protein [Alteribacillus persepolensis]SDH92023.1 penicillin amidase [Alteribacillus persepolensis]